MWFIKAIVLYLPASTSQVLVLNAWITTPEEHLNCCCYYCINDAGLECETLDMLGKLWAIAPTSEETFKGEQRCKVLAKFLWVEETMSPRDL